MTCGAHAGEVVPFDIIPFFRGQHTVIGSFVYTREELEKVLAFAARGLLRPLVHASYPARGGTRGVHGCSRAATHFGKILAPSMSGADDKHTRDVGVGE